MKVIGHYEFSNNKAFQTVFLSATDTETMKLPACDSIGLRRLGTDAPMMVMRPDEALIMARMLIEAVWKTTISYEVQAPN